MAATTPLDHHRPYCAGIWRAEGHQRAAALGGWAAGSLSVGTSSDERAKGPAEARLLVSTRRSVVSRRSPFAAVTGKGSGRPFFAGAGLLCGAFFKAASFTERCRYRCYASAGLYVSHELSSLPHRLFCVLNPPLRGGGSHLGRLRAVCKLEELSSEGWQWTSSRTYSRRCRIARRGEPGEESEPSLPSPFASGCPCWWSRQRRQDPNKASMHSLLGQKNSLRLSRGRG